MFLEFLLDPLVSFYFLLSLPRLVLSRSRLQRKSKPKIYSAISRKMYAGNFANLAGRERTVIYVGIPRLEIRKIASRSVNSRANLSRGPAVPKRKIIFRRAYVRTVPICCPPRGILNFLEFHVTRTATGECWKLNQLRRSRALETEERFTYRLNFR